MKIEVLWDENNIMSIEKCSSIFYTIVDKSGVEKARKCGFPLFFLKDVTVISKELPYFIKRRIYDLNRKDKNSEELANELIRKIEGEKKIQEITSPIDKIRIRVEI